MKRLTQAEIIAELRAVLTDGGWLPALTKADGPGPLPHEASTISDVARALTKHSHAGSLHPLAALQLSRAAQAAADAAKAEQVEDESAVYGMLGTALAYVVQAQGSTETPGPVKISP